MFTEMLTVLASRAATTSWNGPSALIAQLNAIGLSSETIQKHFHLSWPVPIGVLVMILIAILAWVLALYARETRLLAGKDTRQPREGEPGRLGRMAGLVALRLSALALLLILWAGPTLERSRIGPPALVILADRSASMNHRDPRTASQAPDALPVGSPAPDATPSSARPTRFTHMVRYLLAGKPSLLSRLEESYRVELVTFGDTIRRLAPTGSQSLADLLRALPATDKTEAAGATRLGDALDYALREEAKTQAEARFAEAQPAAVLLLSDGIGTRGEPLLAAANRARNLSVPVYTVAIGSEHPSPNISLDEPIVAENLFLGDSLSIESTVRAEGLAGQPARVVLRDKATGRILAQMAIKLPPDGKGKTVALQLRPKETGQLSLELRVERSRAGQGTDPAADQAARKTNRSDADSLQRRLPPRTTDDPFAKSSEDPRQRQLEVRVHQEPIRVLLVQSSPSYEFRTLKAVLGRDPALRMDVWLQEADTLFSEVDATALRHFPLGRQELLPYDVLIWGDVDPEPLPGLFWPRLLHWVTERGGGLALIAGPRFFPAAYQENPQWGLLLPIRPGGGTGAIGTYSIQPTPLGQRDPSMWLADTQSASQTMWQKMPAFSWLWKTAQVKPGARRLAEATTPDSNTRWPAIVRHFVGAGEVWMHLTDETWRLRYRRDDRVFARYWGQVVRRLARGKLLAHAQGVRLWTDRSEYRPGEGVRVRLRFRDPAQAPDQGPLVLQCESPEQPNRSLELPRRGDLPGFFETTLQALPVGPYRLRWLPPVSPTDKTFEPAGQTMPAVARFTVSAPPGELARLAVDRRALAKTARETGGKSYTLATADRLANDLPPAAPVILEHLPSRRLASEPMVIGLLVSLLAVEWILRRRWGMM